MNTRIVRRLLVAVAACAVGSAACEPAFAAPAATGLPQASAAAANGPLMTWGLNQDGELGDGTTTGELVPVAVNPPRDFRASSVRVGTFALVVNASGQVFTWGRGLQGELGDGAFKSRLRPVRVHLPKGVKVSSAREGAEFAVAVTTKGKVLAWGEGKQGELGNGHRASRDVPVSVRLPRGVKITAVSACAECAIVLTSTGRVLAWGDNTYGQLGDGKKGSTDTPVWVRLPRHTRITAIAGGVGHLFAVTSTGGLLSWGDNFSRDLGIGANGLRRVPVRVHLPRGVKVRSASAGLLHSLALTTTGRVLAWGDNADGQLGIGTVTGHSVPVFVHLPKTVHIVSVAAGRYHSLALNRSGKVLAWGDGGDGQLGNGTQTNETLPVQIMVPGKVIAIGSACESDSSIAVLTKIID